MTSDKQTRIIRLPRVCEITGASRATIWRWVSIQTLPGIPPFPQPFKLGPNLTVWDETEVLAWLDECKAHRTPHGEPA